MRVTGAKLECIYCEESLVVGDKNTGRSFMLVYKRFMRAHALCEVQVSINAKKIEVNNAITKAMKG